MYSVHFDNMNWTKPCQRLDDIEWLLRYGDKMDCDTLSEEDKLVIASVMACYKSLIGKTNKQRNYIANKIKSGTIIE